MIDDYYKLKLVNKITLEKQDYIDDLGEYFNKKFLKGVRRILEEKVSSTNDTSFEDLVNDEFEEIPSIIYSEEELDDVMTSNNNEKDMMISKQKFENEEMIGALKEIENKIEIGEIKEENENEHMESSHYNNIIGQKDEEGNLINTKERTDDNNNVEEIEDRTNEMEINEIENKSLRKETLLTLTGKARESNSNLFTEKSNKKSEANNPENLFSDNVNNNEDRSLKNTQNSLRKSDKSMKQSQNSIKNVSENNQQIKEEEDM